MATTAAEVKALVNIVEASEGAFDPFMLRHHVFTEDQERRWLATLMVTFIEFCREELSGEEFRALHQRVLRVYGGNSTR